MQDPFVLGHFSQLNANSQNIVLKNAAAKNRRRARVAILEISSENPVQEHSRAQFFPERHHAGGAQEISSLS